VVFELLWCGEVAVIGVVAVVVVVAVVAGAL
jgi:hypothetical protein